MVHSPPSASIKAFVLFIFFKFLFGIHDAINKGLFYTYYAQESMQRAQKRRKSLGDFGQPSFSRLFVDLLHAEHWFRQWGRHALALLGHLLDGEMGKDNKQANGKHGILAPGSRSISSFHGLQPHEDILPDTLASHMCFSSFALHLSHLLT